MKHVLGILLEFFSSVLRAVPPALLAVMPSVLLAAVPSTSLDIGSVGAPGSTTIANNGAYTVRASGADIWNERDELRFVHASFAGDGEVVARVDSLVAADPWTKAGVMIRETLDAGSRFAFVLLSGDYGAGFQYRAAPGVPAGGAGMAKAPEGAPLWLRVRRAGDAFSAYVSQDGATWVQRGWTVAIPMSPSVYAGLAVTSHRDGAYATAAFSGVRVLPKASVRGGAMLTWTAPRSFTSGAALDDLVAFKVYWGQAPGVHSRALTINNPAARAWTIAELPAGLWYFAVSAISVEGGESAKSNEGVKLVL